MSVTDAAVIEGHEPPDDAGDLELARMDRFYEDVDVRRSEVWMPLVDFEDSEGRLHSRPSDEGSSVYEMQNDLMPSPAGPGCREPECENRAAATRGMYAFMCDEHKEAKKARRAEAASIAKEAFQLEDDAGGAVEFPPVTDEDAVEEGYDPELPEEEKRELAEDRVAELEAVLDSDLVVLAQAVENAQRHLDQRVNALRNYMLDEGWLT